MLVHFLFSSEYGILGNGLKSLTISHKAQTKEWITL